MKEFSSELGQSYDTYSFGYCNYAVKENKDPLSEIYKKGYLPFSGSPDVENIFYMARSARIPLNKFSETSENRRIGSKFNSMLYRKTFPLNKFDSHNKEFVSFCTNYFSKRHGTSIMPEDRLRHILKGNLVTHISSYTNKSGVLVGYVFEVADTKMSHFWFSFYDLDYTYQSLGMWLMLDSAKNAKKEGKDYFYVGTVYGDKALYKSNFKQIEFWNGKEWVSDLRKLKDRSRSDKNRVIQAKDEFKAELTSF